MGVPAFFRWLSRKYPSIVVHCVEEKVKIIQGINVTVDATLPNPNEIEFHNLYLDMNGIIHPCSHPEDKPPPENEDEMMIAIFEYIDRIFNIVRPRRLLYMAIDGVAPRAKMNQQRSRRFRAAKESKEKLEEIKRLRKMMKDKGYEVPPLKPDSAHFDSNCITPGTEFMANLAICLRYYIHDRLNNNPAWKRIKVILSDANVPGEGEHKIMDYIRKQRSSKGHDPNTHHCLYGADADLIMLGLATHEPYFTILREEFKPNQPRPCEICNQYGHNMRDCTGETRNKEGEFDELATSNIAVDKQFIFIRINILREYLEREFSSIKRIEGFRFDLDRAIDDWVFMCFFVGNDFLPHLPSLQIREGAIDRLIRLYKEFMPVNKLYLTENGYVNVKAVQMILSELGEVEDEIFRNRREKEKVDKQRQRQRSKRSKIEDYRAPSYIPEQLMPTPLGFVPTPAVNARHDAYKMRQASTLASNQEAAKNMKDFLKRSKSLESFSSADTSNQVGGVSESTRVSRKRGADDERRGGTIGDSTESEDSEAEDEVRLWEEGWKERYYQSKFGVSCTDTEFVCQVVESYAQGLCWVMLYYYQGCRSWKWYYPFHYAPFASDFRHIGQIRDSFEPNSSPFRPLEQLMGVFPAASCKFLPPKWQDLMLDEDSPIIDFYPTDFRVDLNGKKFAWQGVALLPFVDEQRLINALNITYNTLTSSEKARNSVGCDCVYIHKYNRLYAFARTLYEDYQNPSDQETVPEPVSINPQLSEGMSGKVWPDRSMRIILQNKGYVESPLPSCDAIKNSQTICLNFQDPWFLSDFIFESKLLPDVTLPHPTLRPEDMVGGLPGSYRPQIGFSPRTNQEPYKTPEAAGRFIRNALSDDRQRQQKRGPSFASWSPLPRPPSFSSSSDNSRPSFPPPSRDRFSYTSPNRTMIHESPRRSYSDPYSSNPPYNYRESSPRDSYRGGHWYSNPGQDSYQRPYQYPSESRGQTYPSDSRGQYPSESRGQYSSDSRGQYPSDSRGQYPSESRGRYSSDSRGQYPSDSRGQYSPDSRGRYSFDSRGQYPSDSRSQYHSWGYPPPPHDNRSGPRSHYNEYDRHYRQ